MNDELEITPEQRMEPVSHPDTSIPIILIWCSRRRVPTPTPNAGYEPSAASVWTGP
jgi:hypothetical protein